MLSSATSGARPGTSAAVQASCDALGALSEPLRWQIVSLLSDGEQCVCDLEGVLGLTQSRLSYHLSVLRKAQVVSARKEGRWVYYSVSADVLESLSGTLGQLADACLNARINPRVACCD